MDMERRDIRSKECMFAVHRGMVDGIHISAPQNSSISLVLMVMNLKELIEERSRENSTSTITLLTPYKYERH